MNNRFSLLFFFLLLSVCSVAKVNFTVDNLYANGIGQQYVLKNEDKIKAAKYSLVQRFAIKIYNWKIRRQSDHDNNNDAKRIERKAIWAKWLGIGSLIGLFVPGLGLLSLPAAIIAVVFGMQTEHKTSHPKYAKQGITFGFITIGLLLIVGSMVALVTLLPVG